MEPFYRCIYQGWEGRRVTCSGALVSHSWTADRCVVVCGDGLKHYTEELSAGELAPPTRVRRGGGAARKEPWQLATADPEEKARMETGFL